MLVVERLSVSDSCVCIRWKFARWSASFDVIACVKFYIERLRLSTSLELLVIEISCSVSSETNSERTCSVFVGMPFCSVVSSLRVAKVTPSIVCTAVCLAVCRSVGITVILIDCVLFTQVVS